MGFFNPQMADQALTCFEMMDFGIEQVQLQTMETKTKGCNRGKGQGKYRRILWGRRQTMKKFLAQ